MGLSNVEDILQAGLDGTDLPRPESRIAELLKEWIEQGGNIDDILVAGSNITLTKNADGTITIAASGEVSSEDTVARAEIAAIKDGETLDSFGDVETALADKADASTTYTKTEIDTTLSNKADKFTTYTKTEVDTALEGKADITDIPTVPITAIQKNGTGITPVSGTVNITVPTTAADVTALPDTTKYAAALSLTINSSTYVMTGQLKDQNGDNLGTAQTIDLPLESVVVNGSYNSQTKKVVLTLQNGNTIEFSVADLVSGLQTELSANNKLNPAYINYDSTHRAVSDTEKSTWNGKQSALSTAQLAAVNSGMTSEDVEQINMNKNNILYYQENGSKNALDCTLKTLKALNSNWSDNVCNQNGVNYTVNNDGSITVSGTSAAGDSYFKLSNGVNIGDCKLTGCPSGGGSQRYMIYVTTPDKADTGSGNTYTGNSGAVYIIVRTAMGTVTDLEFKPMISPANMDSTYQQYAPSNAELYAMIQALNQ